MEYELFCSDCKTNTEVVLDHATGDTICTECALVLESHYIDDSPEWRTFSDDSKDNDPVRVGEKNTFTTILLADAAVLSTIVSSKGTKAAFMPPSFPGNKRDPSAQQSPLVAGLNTIANMSDRLGLVTTIKCRASELYKKAQDRKRSRERNHDAILAACLYIACSQENKPRTVKEIFSVSNGITTKEFLRAKKYLVKEVQMGHVDMGTTEAGDFLRRFCSYLGMNNRSIKAAQEAVDNIQTSETIDIRRNPTSIAAAVIYIITQLSKEKTPTPLRDICTATGVADGTIRNTYKDLYPHVASIIPSWFAKMEDLAKLCRPRNT